MQRQSIPLIMAPLAGITDSVFRRIVKRFWADIVYTEMVSAKGLYYGDKRRASCFGHGAGTPCNGAAVRERPRRHGGGCPAGLRIRAGRH